MQKTAWRMGDQLGRLDTYDAEYVALMQLQGDGLVMLNEELIAAAGDLVALAPFVALFSPVADP